MERYKLSIGGNDTEGYITDKIEHKTYFLRSDDVKQEITGILNQFYNENEDLKTDISVLNRHYDEYEKICSKLKRENEQLKKENQRLSEQKHIYKQDWKHLCIDKELLDSENEGLKEDNAILKHALSRIICEFDEHIAKNSEVRDLIKTV